MVLRILRSDAALDQDTWTDADTCDGPLRLHSLKVAFSPKHSALFAADIHLGKAASFRKLGVPVPAGTTEENLKRLTSAISLFKPERLFVLGDFIHAESSHSPELSDKLQGWRSHHRQLELFLIRGNHDKKAGDPEAALGIQALDEPYRLGGLALCHHPKTLDGFTVLAGHTHPAVVLKGKGRNRMRLPCFHVQPGAITFPSFGSFTGSYTITPQAGESAIAISPMN